MEGIVNTAIMAPEAAGDGAKNKGGRPRKIKTVRQMEQAWEDYKAWCDHQMIVTHEFSQKEADFVSARLLRRTTYTIEGFCVFLKIARSKFYENYADNSVFGDTVTRIREECEVDTRLKLETGEIPTQLSGLLLSKYGYTTKVDTGAEARAAALEEARKLLSGVPSVIGMERATDTSSGPAGHLPHEGKALRDGGAAAAQGKALGAPGGNAGSISPASSPSPATASPAPYPHFPAP